MHRNPKFFKAIFARANGQNAKSVSQILKAGEDINSVDRYGRGILHWMPIRTSDNADLFKELIEAGADVNLQSNSGESPLHLAVFNGEVKYVRLLLEAGANTDVTTQEGDIPRDYLNYNSQEIKELLNQGIKLKT